MLNNDGIWWNMVNMVGYGIYGEYGVCACTAYPARAGGYLFQYFNARILYKTLDTQDSCISRALVSGTSSGAHGMSPGVRPRARCGCAAAKGAR